MLLPAGDAADDTIVGKECHIVAQRDHPSVARAPSSLSSAEREEFAELIAHRHAFRNLVLMCGVHSDLIDDPAQGYTVRGVLTIKKEHEDAMDRLRRSVTTAADYLPSPDEMAPTAPLVISESPVWARRAAKALERSDPAALAWLQGRLGDPPSPNRVVELVDEWPPELERGPEDLIVTLIRYAEAAGLWREAAVAWERLSHRFDAIKQADTLARAAVDAGVGGDREARERLLIEAEALDPDSPRVRLERLDDSTPPEEQLLLLEELDSDDPALAAVILCQRARAELLLGRLSDAEQHLSDAGDRDAESWTVEMVSINLRVQRGRVALRDDRAFSLPEVLSALKDALRLRGDLVDMKRWIESGRLLMLAADVPLLLRDLDWARELLERAVPEEVAAPDGAEVLGDAALRAGAADLALRFTEGAAATDAIRRIRATAFVDVPSLGGRRDGLRELEQIATSGSEEAVHAAFARLSACLPPVRADWHAPSGTVLTNSPHRNLARSLRVMAYAAHGEMVTADREASKLPREPWAAEVRLRVAAQRGNRTAVQQAADAFLRFRPDAAGRLLSALALKDAGADEQAIDVLAGVAHDLNAPPRVRADAFHGLLDVLARNGRWEEADRDWHDWRELSRTDLHTPDGRVDSWQVRLVRHGGGQVD